MGLLNNRYKFDCSKYKIQHVEQSSIFISNELFKILCFNDTGFRIINELNGANTIKDIIKKLSMEYGIGEDVIADTVYDFVVKLIDESVIQEFSEDQLPELEEDKCGLDRIFIEITDKCSFCNRENRANNEMSPEFIEDFLEKLQDEDEGAVVSVRGGEPMLHTQFDSIVKILSRNKKNRVIIYTNGMVLKESFKPAIDEYIDGIMLNIAHEDKEVNDSIMGEGHFENFKKAVKFYSDCNASVYMAVTPMVGNIDNLSSLQQLAYDLHMKGIYIQNPILIKKNNKLIDQLDYSDERYLKVIDGLYKTNTFLNSWKNNRIKDLESYFYLILDRENCFNNFSNLKHKPHCGMGINEVSIDVHGNLYPCHMLHNEEFKMQDVQEYILNKEKFKREKISNKECVDCTYWLLCLGGCRAETYYNTGKLNALSSSCEQRKSKIKERINRMAAV